MKARKSEIAGGFRAGLLACVTFVAILVYFVVQGVNYGRRFVENTPTLHSVQLGSLLGNGGTHQFFLDDVHIVELILGLPKNTSVSKPLEGWLVIRSHEQAPKRFRFGVSAGYGDRLQDPTIYPYRVEIRDEGKEISLIDELRLSSRNEIAIQFDELPSDGGALWLVTIGPSFATNSYSLKDSANESQPETPAR